MTEPKEVAASSWLLLYDPRLNKGAAFTEEERDAFDLHGLLPHAVETIEHQLVRTGQRYDRQATDLQRYELLSSVQNTNETLFYAFLLEDLPGRMPIVYTPTVGEACVQFSHIFRRPRGLYLAYPDSELLADRLRNAANTDPEVIVVTDGERILGLGDQGVNGMGIPIGKLALYSACGGIDPSRTLPIVLDVGTNNDELRRDPEYLGWRHERVTGADYDEFVDRFVEAVIEVFPDVLLQWEDFALQHAHPLLARYRDRLCTFNDDIQGTAAVTLAVLLSACRVKGEELADQTVVVVGAGSAGTGIAELAVDRMVTDGVDRDAARRRFWFVDAHGLLTDDEDGLADFQRPFARPRSDTAGWPSAHDRPGLAETVARVQPTILIGVSGAGGIFTEEVVRTMAAAVERPAVFPLSNPTARAEAVPADVLRWTDGRALVATGSPFGPVTVDGVSHDVAQSNNSYIFPGLGLGVLAAGATRVTTPMFLAAAAALAETPGLGSAPGASLLPPLERAREVSSSIAVAVATAAVEDGVAPAATRSEIERAVGEKTWTPEYRPYVRAGT